MIPITRSANPPPPPPQPPPPPPPDRKFVCCCELKAWTKTIALLQILFYGIISLVLIVIGVVSSSKKENLSKGKHYRVVKVPTGGAGGGWSQPDHHDETTNIFTLICITIGPPLGIIFGFILYAGAHCGKPGLLFIWLVVALIVLIISGATAYLPLFFNIVIADVGFNMDDIWSIIFWSIPTGIYLFFLYVVYHHRRELINERNLSQNPTVQFHPVQTGTGPSCNATQTVSELWTSVVVTH